MGDRESDQLLVERVKSGDKQAFGLLVVKYQSRLARLVGRMVYDTSEIEDIVQDSFIRAYRALPEFRNDSAFYSWLYRIGVNAAKSWLSTHGRRKAAARSPLESDEENPESDYLDRLIQDNATPENVLMSKQVGEAVNRALEGLSEEIRMAIVLCEIDGLSYEEIAQAMDCPIGTVRSRIFRAREAISLKLKPLLDTAPNRRW